MAPDVRVRNSLFGAPKEFALESVRTFAGRMLEGQEFPAALRDAAATSLALLAVLRSDETRAPVEAEYLDG